MHTTLKFVIIIIIIYISDLQYICYKKYIEIKNILHIYRNIVLDNNFKYPLGGTRKYTMLYEFIYYVFYGQRLINYACNN